MWEDLLRMNRFSQRKGFKPVAELIQIDSMNSELRNSLWNALDVEIWSNDYINGQYRIEPFSRVLWFHFLTKPIDSRPHYVPLIPLSLSASNHW